MTDSNTLSTKSPESLLKEIGKKLERLRLSSGQSQSFDTLFGGLRRAVPGWPSI